VDGLAATAAASGDPAEAARLWGAADALLGPGAPDRDPIEQALLKRFRPGVELELGPAVYRELSATGASLTAAEILAAKAAATSLSRTSLSQ
jgi:hypothetical protein